MEIYNSEISSLSHVPHTKIYAKLRVNSDSDIKLIR